MYVGRIQAMELVTKNHLQINFFLIFTEVYLLVNSSIPLVFISNAFNILSYIKCTLFEPLFKYSVTQGFYADILCAF